MFMSKRIFFTLFVAGFLLACVTQKKPAPADSLVPPVGVPVEIKPPLGLPVLPVPAANRPTADAIALGQKLFHDVKLSRDNTISCASCHLPQKHFVDGQAVATGIGGQRGTRNAPTLLNAAYSAAQFWDGRAASLEQQAQGPITATNEMNMPAEMCVARLTADASYKEEFAKVFGSGPITMSKIEQALASFERTLLSGNSPFDQSQFGGVKTALSAAALRGLAVFKGRKKGNCVACHTIGEQFALFTDGKFHNLGVGLNASGELTDLGRFTVTGKESERGLFRTPSLRNVAKTAPYMHDGSLKTLTEVIDFYLGGGNSNPQLDSEIKPLPLTAQERSDLLAFLASLTGEMPAHTQQARKE